RNTFEISVAEKTRLYGMLSSIGATQKQIKQSVLKEGFYLGIIGIPIGVISGLLTGLILILFINHFLVYLDSDSFFVFKISWFSVIVAILLSSLTIYLSAIKSAKKASKITEIEAIKNQKDIKLNSKKLNTPKYIESIFKTGGVLAYKNMKRNKSKYRATVVSLIVSITSFIAISYFVEIGFAIAQDDLVNYSYDILVEVKNQTDENTIRIHDDIANLDYVKQYVTYQSKMLFVDAKYAGFDLEEMAFGNYIYFEVITVNDEAYLEYIKELGLEYEETVDKAFIISNELIRQSADGSILEVLNLIDEKHKTIEMYKDEFKMDIELTSGHRNLMGLEKYDNGSARTIVLVSNELYKKIENEDNVVNTYFKAEDVRGLQSLLNDYKYEKAVDFEMINLSEEAQLEKNIILFVSFFLYGFIGVITLIGITNIFNTITTNMMLRQREFAILKSTGMTNKEFNNSVRLESVFLGSKALCLGVAFGLILAYLMYKVLEKSEVMTGFEFSIPYKSIILAIVFVFIIVTLIMKYSMSKINKQNIIETIKNENI
ncbi:MAG: FtsX-like permease family protein, partial [bacterium]